MSIYLFLCVIGYALFSIFLLKGWKKIALVHKLTSVEPRTTVAVIVPIRNEAAVLELILNDLKNQNYPAELLTVYLANDDSVDGTVDIISEWILRYPTLFKRVELDVTFQFWKGKKKWIASAIAKTEAQFILTTDADCRLQANWVRSMVQTFEHFNVQFVSGPVKMVGKSSMGNSFQQIEFSSLIGSGASSIGLGIPLMCNGANVGYARAAYVDVDGFEGNGTIASGDDEFLMHKIYAKYGSIAVVFCKNNMAIVSTATANSWKEFFNQRKRWASKWENYTLKYVQFIAFWVFLFHLTVLVYSLLAAFLLIDWSLPLVLWGTKMIFDYFYLKSIARFLSIDFKKSTFIYVVLIYPLYVVVFGISARFGTYTWKERVEKLS